ncbi:MAG: aminomethyl-transferring glycine dehydrogenase subunit GcvPA, partial [Armatimonadetes bacterium]|nr:aminomethyl-transferring glycine dehydrogenase subunit GcvPA [Armatimonadota bacterium]
HIVPSAVGHILSRSEFYTAYTPYQAEVSQGTLQAIYEFQSLLCILTQMDVANASVYDGATATAEAAIMACEATGRKQVVVFRDVHPHYREVLRTYLGPRSVEVLEAPLAGCSAGFEKAKELVSRETAAVIIQNPGFFGQIYDGERFAFLAHSCGSLLITVVTDPVSLGCLRPPGSFGSDIVAGEAQALGNHPGFGGPHVGYLAATRALLRRIPGRLVGLTGDKDGRRGFVLTLQAREQHIRREKATSNLCTNQALCALAVTTALSILGKTGLAEMAHQCLHKAHYAFSLFIAEGGCTPLSRGPFFHEFALNLPADPEEVVEQFLNEGLLAGYPLGRDYPEFPRAMLFCVTETVPGEEIAKAARILANLKTREGVYH